MKSTLILSSKWDKRYLELASVVASWSKDPSSKVGAVAVGDKGQVLSQGFNGFARGVDDTEERLNTRDQKYKFIVHAEMNAIFNAAFSGVSLEGSVLYVTGLPCCSECAKGIVQVGVKRVVMELPQFSNPRWKDSWMLSAQMFDEAGVKYEFVK
jgi:dCMP deaminase|tara:strand:- start:8949 stop:9410 length:462 start_codon:yes stop_codon:yes gene_type:complete